MGFDKSLTDALAMAASHDIYEKYVDRGVRYALSGQVTELDFVNGNEFISKVSGSTIYSCFLEIFYDNDGPVIDSMTCTCPIGHNCKHVAATIVAILAKVVANGSSLADDILKFIPELKNQKQLRIASAAKTTPAFDALFTGAGIKKQESVKQISRVTPQIPWWEEFLSAKSERDATQVLSKEFESRCINLVNKWALSDFASLLKIIGNRVDFLEYFDKVVERFAKQRHIQLHPPYPGLEEFLHSPRAVEIKEELNLRALSDSLKNWLIPKTPPTDVATPTSVDVQWFLHDTKSPDVPPMIAFRLLVTSRNVRRRPRALRDIYKILMETQEGRRWMDDADYAFADWISGQSSVIHNVSSDYYNDGSADYYLPDAVMWMTKFPDYQKFEWANGNPVRINSVPARLEFKFGGDRVEAVIALNPDGGEPLEMSLAEVSIVADCNPTSSFMKRISRLYVLKDWTLHILDNMGLPYSTIAKLKYKALPMSLLRESDIGAMLIARLLANKRRIPSGVARAAAVRATVELHYDDGSITLRAHAESGDGITFTRGNGGWARQNVSVANNGNVLDVSAEGEDIPAVPAPETDVEIAAAMLISPRQEDIEPLETWLKKLVPPTTVMTNGDTWTWKLKNADYPGLLQLWEKRPKSVRYLGTQSFKELVTIHRAPRFSVNVESGGTDWFSVSVEMEKEMEAISPKEVRRLLTANNENLVVLTGGRCYRREDLEKYDEQLRALSAAGIDYNGGSQRLHALQLAGESGNVLTSLANMDDVFAELAEKAAHIVRSFSGVPRVEVGNGLADVLRPYQRDGVDFMVWAAKTFGGAILADDMGLGKTVQILAALTALYGDEKLPSLVVCPASVAHNWKREIEKFAPSLKAIVVEAGSDRKKLIAEADKYDVVIKNYHLTRKESESLFLRKWLAVVVDEAQAIKNPVAEITKTVKALDSQYRFALTGTPIENRLTDLWSIADFAVPSFLAGRHAFEEWMKQGDEMLTRTVLRGKLRPVLARRMKSEVAKDLPPRIEERRDCEMTPAQRKLYLAELKNSRETLGAMKGVGEGQKRIMILTALLRLRQICCDPALIGSPVKSGSGKVNEFFDLVEPLLEAGHKVLVFSQFVKMLEILETKLKINKVKTYKLTGQTKNRQELVDGFEKDKEPSIFLISMKAGGVGLNLVSASHIILFDPWWNPAVEAQAIDRAHRIGQDKTVIAFRLVTLGAIEEKIMALQERKKELVRDVLDEGSFNQSLTKDDFEFLLSEISS